MKTASLLSLPVFILIFIDLKKTVCEVPDAGNSEPVLRYRIQEEIRKGTVIGDVLTDSKLPELYPPDVIASLDFRILTPPPLPFVIDAKLGVVRTDGVVDRDSLMLCKDKDICEILLDVAVRPAQYFQIIKVIIIIDDINDNAPHFRDQYSILTIRESTSVGSGFTLPLAGDLDSPRYGVQTYELQSETPNLGLSVTIRRDGTLDARLIIKHPLDRETEDRYEMRLIAYDGGIPPKSASLTLIVNVLDSNDNSPVFVVPSYTVNITENLPIGTSLLRVKATDRDTGLNADITYELSAQTLQLYGHLFSIDNRTGMLSVKGEIDYEKNSVYQLGVTARDRGPDALPTDASIVVRVSDVNDNAPVVQVNTLTARRTSRAEIMENLDTGTFVAHVSVSDPDEGDNGKVGCSISDPSFHMIERYTTEFQILTTVLLDRETQAHYDIQMICFDYGYPRLSTETVLTISVLDTNDNPPRFSNQTYRASLIENNFVGASVLKLEASDSDLAQNADFHFVVPSSVDGLFDVDDSGTIRAKSSLDREQYSRYQFNVLVVDHGSPALTGTATVIVTVEDVNDESPIFSRPSYSFSVEENSPGGTTVGVVSAEDRDSSKYAASTSSAVRYSIVTVTDMEDLISNNHNSNPFGINPTTGAIYTTGPLDRESRPVYTLSVMGFDGGKPPQNTSVLVTVHIQDQNDNDPVFLYPKPANDSVYISNLVPRGTRILSVVCKDSDLGSNARLTYRIDGSTHQAASDTFKIEPQSGDILLQVPLDDVIEQTYVLVLVAMDAGKPVRTGSATLLIYVNASLPWNFPHSGKSGSHAQALIAPRSFILILAGASGSGVLTLMAIIAVALGWRKRRTKKHQRNKSRMEALRNLTAKELSLAECTPLTTLEKDGYNCTGLTAAHGLSDSLCNGASNGSGPKKGSNHKPVMYDDVNIKIPTSNATDFGAESGRTHYRSAFNHRGSSPCNHTSDKPESINSVTRCLGWGEKHRTLPTYRYSAPPPPPPPGQSTLTYTGTSRIELNPSASTVTWKDKEVTGKGLNSGSRERLLDGAQRFTHCDQRSHYATRAPNSGAATLPLVSTSRPSHDSGCYTDLSSSPAASTTGGPGGPVGPGGPGGPGPSTGVPSTNISNEAGGIQSNTRGHTQRDIQANTQGYATVNRGIESQGNKAYLTPSSLPYQPISLVGVNTEPRNIENGLNRRTRNNAEYRKLDSLSVSSSAYCGNIKENQGVSDDECGNTWKTHPDGCIV